MADALINWAASTLDRWPCRLRIRCLSDQGRGASRSRSTSWLASMTRQEQSFSFSITRCVDMPISVTIPIWVFAWEIRNPTGSLASWGIWNGSSVRFPIENGAPVWKM